MKIKHSILLSFILYLFSLGVTAQSNKNIYLNIQNIPKIQHKIQTSKFSWSQDKSPTVTYKLENDATQYEVKFNLSSKSLSKIFKEKTVYLKLRYNPGKYQIYILQKGDSAHVEYANGKPYIELSNRELKKHDEDILSLLDEFDIPKNYMGITKDGKLMNKEQLKERNIKALQEYEKQLVFLDSLFSNDLLSQNMYVYHRNYVLYEKLSKEKKYPQEVLNLKDLHINSYAFLLSMSIRQQLKKPTISLGSGLSVNWIEAFDITFVNKKMGLWNKKYLLEYYLKEMKKDVPFATYDKKHAKYKAAYPNNKIITPKEDANISKIRNIHTLANGVELVDIANNPTTLSDFLTQHKGKVIYIDFWASWCAPCRAAFPAYKDLTKEYKNKDVVFLFISTDRNPDQWQKAQLKEGLTGGLLASNYPDPQFYQDLDLRSVPRYLVFDKDGKLAHHRAPSPKSEDIRTLIDTLLEK